MKKKGKEILFLINGAVFGFLISMFASFLFSEKTLIAMSDELNEGACYYKDIRFFEWATAQGDKCFSVVKGKYPFLTLKIDDTGKFSSMLLHDDKKEIAQFCFGSDDKESAILIYGGDSSVVSGIVPESKTVVTHWYRLDNIVNNPQNKKIYFYDFNFDSIADTQQVVNGEDQIVERYIFLNNEWMVAKSIDLKAKTAIILSESNDRVIYTFSGKQWNEDKLAGDN